MDLFLSDKPLVWREDFEQHSEYFIKIDLSIVEMIYKPKFSEKIIGITQHNRVINIFFVTTSGIQRMCTKYIRTDRFKSLYRNIVIDKLLNS